MVQEVDGLVSIVVPVYNAGKFIEETIGMVRRQTYREWELLLVDDCSTDDGREKIKAWSARDERIRLIAKEKNQGAAQARNTGIDHASGRFLAFLDADDVWMSDKLEKELRFMADKNAAFVFTAYEFGDEDARGTGRKVSVPETITYKEALSRTIIFTTTVMFDLDKIGKDLIRMPDVDSEDTAAWWKILRSGYTAYGLDETLAIYRRPAKSLSSNKWEAIKRIWNLYRNEEKLPFFYSVWNFVWWALRASARRL